MQKGRGRHEILIVEDNRADVFLIREAIAMAQIDAELHVVADGEKAIRFLEEADADASAPSPDVVILDINLPRRQGREVLEVMRRTRRCSDAVVMVVTSSDSAQDREAMSRLGATNYFRKPSEYEDFMKLGLVLKALIQNANTGQ